MKEEVMKFVSIRDLRERSGEVWRTLPGEGEMVITSNGRPIAILAAVSESNLEESLSAFRRARAVEAVASLQRRSVEQGTEHVSTEEIDAEIQAVRRKRGR
jgi:antitoxin (DNA-binding transcriptional repressor) of toxin-antitoxin stability system